MEVKYIVYQRKSDKTPKVDIWQTDGQILHHIYRREHNIAPNEVSSAGYLDFNPQKQMWELEHYPLCAPPPLLWRQYARCEKTNGIKFWLENKSIKPIF